MERQLGQLLIKEHESASVLVSRALIFLVVNKTLIKFMDYPYGQPLKWTTPLWFTDLPLKQSYRFFFPRKFFTRALISERLEQPNIFFSRPKNVPFIHFKDNHNCFVKFKWKVSWDCQYVRFFMKVTSILSLDFPSSAPNF